MEYGGMKWVDIEVEFFVRWLRTSGQDMGSGR